MYYTLLPFKLSLVGIRMAGYMIETNMRVAQVLGEAAMKANPLVPRDYKATMETAPVVKTPKTAPKAVDAVKMSGSKPKREPSMPPAMPTLVNGDARAS